MIDSHCHLTIISKNAKEIETLLKRANKEGIFYFIDVGVNPNDIEFRLELLRDAEGVYLTAGYYPDYASLYTDVDLDAFKLKIKKANENKKHLYALGEIGLDYYHNDLNKKDQKTFFAKLINVASEVNLPIIIHTRDAFKDTFDILKEEKHPERGILHCFSGTVKEAKKALDLGYIISFSGIVTYGKNDFLREVAQYVPSDMYTIETDSPYLTPQKLRGRSNEPAFIPYIAEVIAECRGESPNFVMKNALENTRRVLNFPLID